MTPVDGDWRCRCCNFTRATKVASGIRDWEYGVEGEWSHLACAACGVVQLEPFPTLELLVRAYDIDYHGYAASPSKGPIYSLLYRANDAALRRRLDALVPPPAKVLDVGCGAGEFLGTLKRLGYGPLQGIDFNRKAVDAVHAKGIDAFQGIFLDFPAADRSYDLVVMNNYLEHTLSPAEELARAQRILRPGGVLFGEIPNYRSLDRMLFGRYWGGMHAPRHTFHFSPAALRALLEKSGFRDVRIYQQLNTSHFALSMQNRLQKGRADLRDNPALRHGRARYYPLLLLGLIPLNAVCASLGLSGIMKFSARA